VSRSLDFAEARAIFGRLGDLVDELVLIGGQAVNFWASRYRAAVPGCGCTTKLSTS
jgi:hypothetical protein